MRLLFFLVLCLSCTKEKKFSKEDLFSLGQKAEPSVTLVLPKTMNEGVSCSEYTAGCVSAHIISVKGLEMIAVEFLSTEQAMEAAKKFKGYYSRNWFFDDVTGEPFLERFVVSALEAKKP